MKQIWSPWRSRYIETFAKPARKGKKQSLFTAALRAGNDDREFIVWKGRLSFVIMNRYPYNSGHLLVVPYRQVPGLTDLTSDELLEMMEAVRRSMIALGKIMRPQGFNFGANIGRAGGAGVEQHVHFHVVPRWVGDTNCMPVLAGAKVISQDMKTTLRKLRRAF
ncbi:MAG: HIT domain-containing protein [Bacteroidota bacterium]